ncbi:MAG: hypothetical protein AAGB04_18200, partial [Pseudomonadota bacterium]
MTALGLRLIIALCGLVVAGAPILASEPTTYPEPMAETLPAVDGVNSKLSFEHGIDGDGSLGGTGSITVPLGHAFGVQFDVGMVNREHEILDDATVYRGAAHLFWRDPSKGLLGL